MYLSIVCFPVLKSYAEVFEPLQILLPLRALHKTTEQQMPLWGVAAVLVSPPADSMLFTGSDESGFTADPLKKKTKEKKVSLFDRKLAALSS